MRIFILERTDFFENVVDVRAGQSRNPVAVRKRPTSGFYRPLSSRAESLLVVLYEAPSGASYGLHRRIT